MQLDIGLSEQIEFPQGLNIMLTIDKLPQGARKSAAKTATFRAPLALTVSIDLSASDGERDEIRVGKGGEGQKATISARSARRSGGCCAFDNRAKPNAKSDDFGAVWTQVRRLFRLR